MSFEVWYLQVTNARDASLGKNRTLHCDIPLALRPATEDPTSKYDETRLSTVQKPCTKPS